MPKINDTDTCLICGAHFDDDNYCASGHIRPQADIIHKYFKKIDEYTGPMGGHYSAWTNNRIAVTIHDDDDEIVSVIDVDTKKCLYIDDRTAKALNLIRDSGVRT